MQTPLLAQDEKHKRAEDGAEQPEQHVDEIDPHAVLHALDARVAFGFFVDVHAAEDAEEGGVEDAV